MINSVIALTMFFAGCLNLIIYFINKKEKALLAAGVISFFAAFYTAVSSSDSSIDSHFLRFSWLFVILLATSRLLLDFIKEYRRIVQIADKLAGSDRVKDTFLINTARELKIPLYELIGLAEIMLGNSGNTDDHESLSLIIASARKLTGLVDNILTFSRKKSRGISLNKRPVCMRQAVNIVFSILRPLARERNIRLINDINEYLPDVYADENCLFQIVYSIAENSARFTVFGEIRANAAVKGNMLEVTISDTGIGMHPDKIKTIFTLFKNSNVYENISDEELTLGLYMTKKLVEINNGTIFAETDPQAGSKIIFSLPLSIGKKPQQSTVINSGTTPAVFPGIVKDEYAFSENPGPGDDRFKYDTKSVIFVADDEPVSLKLIFNILNRKEYIVHKFNNNMDLISYISKNGKPDLAIIDIMMPGLSGYDACSRLREIFALHELPILLLTVNDHPADINAGFEAGANDYLAKPFHEKELLARVKNLLDLKKALTIAANAELGILQAQIKPHFLHNTISAIMSLVRTDPETARNMLMELSNYLRASFRYKHTSSMIPLTDELSIVKSYLYIMSCRFPGKINIIYNMACSPDINIPHLILQPIVENAVKHGVLKKPGKGIISISAEKAGSYLIVCISDDGLGIEKEMISSLLNGKSKGTGIGIINVHRRLTALYGCGLQIESEPGNGTKVIMRLPLKEE